MKSIEIEDFKDYVRKQRKDYFDIPFKFAYKVFCELGYDKQDNDFFRENASEFIETMRENCWNKFVPLEKKFMSNMLSYLIDTDEVNKLSPVDAIKAFVEKYPQHIYDLSLSTTQSRRSRAGKEFEAIIMLLLVGANISADEQGAIGKKYFQEHNLGKLVDFVGPSVLHYEFNNKRDSFVLSLKTTLRERWQEVPEEVSRTAAREMFLVTLDDSISEETINILVQSNIYIVTTKNLKNQYYSDKRAVITFEDMIKEAIETCKKWNDRQYKPEEIGLLTDHFHKIIKKYVHYPFIKEYYIKKLNEIDSSNFILTN